MRVLDYGAGRGAMALELKKRGADVVAVEPFGCDYLIELGVSAYRDLSDLPAHGVYGAGTERSSALRLGAGQRNAYWHLAAKRDRRRRALVRRRSLLCLPRDERIR